MDDFYREQILDHYKNPRNRGHLDHPDIHEEGSNPLCGDQISIDIRVKDGRIDAVRFDGKGCSISQASASMLAEELVGQPVERVREMSKEDVLEMLGIEIGPVRLKCALLPLEVFKVGVYEHEGWALDEEWSRDD